MPYILNFSIGKRWPLGLFLLVKMRLIGASVVEEILLVKLVYILYYSIS